MTTHVPAPPRAEPAYFEVDGRACLRWLHRPPTSIAARDMGIVICNPFGYEALCAHRSLRHLAEEAATRGFAALRFDYDGTGDSAGDDFAADRWSAWRASVLSAVAELRRESGVTRVCLVGVRLGASLAASAAATDGTAIEGLALIAPIVSGKPWLRELRALQATMGRPAGPPEFALPEGAQESVGLVITPETRVALEALDLAALGARLPQEILLLDRDDRPPSASLVSALGVAGRRVEHAVLPGYVEMMLDPHDAVVPAAMIASVLAWTEARAGTATLPAAAGARAAPVAASGPVTVGAGIEEQVRFLDADSRLVGIVSAPAGARPTRAVLLLNSGANHHIGNGRLYVKFARRLAAKGWLVLRYDVSGIGDSGRHAGAPENEVYTAHGVADLRTAVEFLLREFGPTHVEAMGLCSGAYNAFKGAVAGLPIHGATIVNPLVFFWKRGMSLAYPPFVMVQAAAQYQRSMLQATKWLKLVRGQVDVRAIARVVWHRVDDRARSAGREVARALHLPVRDDLAAELSQVVDRGIALRFIFSEGDPGEALLEGAAGRRLGRLRARGAISLDHLGDCDHSLSCAWMHEALWARVAPAFDAS